MMVLFVGGPLHGECFPVTEQLAESGHFTHPIGHTYSLLRLPHGTFFDGRVKFVGVFDSDPAGVEAFVRTIAGHLGLHVS